MNIHTEAGWAKSAEITNTKAYTAAFGREPNDYSEVLTWVYSFVTASPMPEPASNFVVIGDREFEEICF